MLATRVGNPLTINERAKAAGDIGEWRRLAEREYDRDDGGHHDGHAYWDRNSQAWNGLGHPMNDERNDGSCHQSFHPQFAFDGQINRHQRRNNCATDIDRNYRTFPMTN